MRSVRRRRISTVASPRCGRLRPSAASARKAFSGSRPICSLICVSMDLMDQQPEFTKSVWDYLDVLVTDRADRARPRNSRQERRDLRVSRESIRRRSLYHCRDLGHRVELRHAGRRPQRAQLHRDTGLHRPPSGLFQGRVSRRAGNSASRRSDAAAIARLMGRRVRRDAVHADRVQEIRGGTSITTANATWSMTCRTSSPRPR